MLNSILLSMIGSMMQFISIAAIVIILVLFITIIKTWKKAEQGQALVRTGSGGTKVSFSGIFVIPVFHQLERMDITLKTMVIARQGKEGLICKDNMRADIKVSFYVRVNQTTDDVKQVAQSIGCDRASNQDLLVELFDSKFSEGLKTVGKKFDFVDLYNSRDLFKQEIIQVIGTDLNGYTLEDCAIDYLEQTPIEALSAKNILDAEGIKKITELTASQLVLANQIERDKEKTIKKQDVEAKETMLQLDRELAEKEELQQREIANIKDREQAAIHKVKEEQRLIAERARIAAEEEIQIAEQNRMRQVQIAEKNKERAVVLESEKVEKDRQLEITERQRIVEIAEIQKERAVEEERKNIQDVIKERVMVEKTVVTEEEKIKDARAFAEAERLKKTALISAEKEAEKEKLATIMMAEAEKEKAKHQAEQRKVEAEAEFATASKLAEAAKVEAEAKAAQEAAIGMAEAQVAEAKAEALEKQGMVEAKIVAEKAGADAKAIEVKALAEAKSIDAKSLAEAESQKRIGLAQAEVIESKAAANEKQGLAESNVLLEKSKAEATGIEAKAEAMKKLDGVGREHEEFKLRLEKETMVRLEQLKIDKDIAHAQAMVIAEALKASNIDIVGGETMFFDQIMGAVTKGKSIDRTVGSSNVLSDIKQQFFNSADGKSFKDNLANFIDQFGLGTEEVKNMSLSKLLLKMGEEEGADKDAIGTMLGKANVLGLANKTLKELGL